MDKKETILVCDDDKNIVDAIEIYLTQEGYRVVKAYDGEEAIDGNGNGAVHADELLTEGNTGGRIGICHSAQTGGLGVGDDVDAQNIAFLIDAHHHGDGVVEAAGENFHGIAQVRSIHLGNQGGCGEIGHFFAATGQNCGNGSLGLLGLQGLDGGLGDGVDTGQQSCHQSGDQQQGNSQTGNIQSGGFGLHIT